MPSDELLTRMRGTCLQMSSPEVYSKRFSDFVRHFRNGEFGQSLGVQRRVKYAASFRDELARITNQKQTKRDSLDSKRAKKKMTVGQVTSESPTLPPITSSCSDITAAVANGNTHSSVSTPFTGGVKDDAVSPVPKKDGSKLRINAQGLTKSQDFTRLSPIASSEKRGKGEVKCDAKVVSLTPRGSMPRIVKRSSQDLNSKNERLRLKGQLKTIKGRSQEEPFSVRRKIEQYRKWHEEQYTDKLKKFKQDVDKFGADNNKVADNTNVGIDLSRIFDCASKSSCERKIADKNINIDDVKASLEYSAILRRKQKKRLKTAATWKTWRDVNQSDAYDDVNKYIEENELMTPEKESWIRNWVFEVERAMFSTDDSNSDVDESVFI